MAKRPFRSVGQRVRDYARGHINNYVSSGDVVSRSELPPSWQQNAQEPLIYAETPSAQPPSDIQTEQTPETEEQPLSPEQIWQQRATSLFDMLKQREAETEARQAAGQNATDVQRAMGDGGDSPSSLPRRRRGAVVDVPSQRPAVPPDETPEEEGSPSDFFFLNEPGQNDVQRIMETSSPVAQQQPEPEPTRADNPPNSFWRRLFSRGDDTPDISLERAESFDDDLFEEFADTRQVEPVEPQQLTPEENWETPNTTGEAQTSQANIQHGTSQLSQHAPQPDTSVERQPTTSTSEPTPQVTRSSPPAMQRQSDNPPISTMPHMAEDDFAFEPDQAALDSPSETPSSSQATRPSMPVVQRESSANDQAAPQLQWESSPLTAQSFPSVAYQIDNETAFSQAEPDELASATRPIEPIASDESVEQLGSPFYEVSSTPEPPSVSFDVQSAPSEPTIQRSAAPETGHESITEPEEPPDAAPEIRPIPAQFMQPPTSSIQREYDVEDEQYRWDEVENQPEINSSEAQYSHSQSEPDAPTTFTPIPSQDSPTQTPKRVTQVQRKPAESTQDSSNYSEHIPSSVQTAQTIQRETEAVSQPDDPEWQDAPTTFTPMSDAEIASASPAPTSVQRETDQPANPPPKAEARAAPDAPTTLTPTPEQIVGFETPQIQRQTTAHSDALLEQPAPRDPALPPSPWTGFMNPSETPHQRIKRPTPPVQRAPEQPTQSRVSDPAPASDSEALPPIAQNPVDLFTAMRDAGMITSEPTDAVSKPPQISRQSAPESSNPSAQPSLNQPIQQDSSMEQVIPPKGSVDADLLSLLDLPTDTPILRRKTSEIPVERSNDPPTSSHGANQPDYPPNYIAPPIREDGDDRNSIMRAQPTTDPAPTSTEGSEQPQGEGDINVDKLARDVLSVLRQRLRIEQERGGRKS
jgi:hypothetical protein